MTREETIRFLNEQREFLLKGCFWEETRMKTNEAFDMATKALEADVTDIRFGKWIPTSKKLPKIDQPVLVWVNGDYWIADLHLLDGELCWGFDDFDLFGEDFDNVRAWMPLPKPYMEEKNERSN